MAMKKAGASQSGTGEQRIKQTVPTVDVILASLNLVLPGAMLGEVTPGIAHAILGAPGRKLLLPLNRAHVEVVGAEALTLESLIDRAVRRVEELLSPFDCSVTRFRSDWRSCKAAEITAACSAESAG